MINLTFTELCEELSRLEETELIELLDLRSSDIVDKFQDIIEDNIDILTKEVLEYTDKEIDIDE